MDIFVFIFIFIFLFSNIKIPLIFLSNILLAKLITHTCVYIYIYIYALYWICVYLGYDVCGYVDMCIMYVSYKIWNVRTRVLHCCMVVACTDGESNTVVNIGT